MRQHIKHVLSKTKWIALIMLIDTIFFGFANPLGSNSLISIVGSVLLGVTIYAFFLLFMSLLAVVMPVLEKPKRRLALFASILVIFLLLMQSIGQLGLRDVIGVVLLVLVLYVYVTYLSGHTVEDTK